MPIKLTLAGAAALIALVGCGSSEPQPTPAACLAPAADYLAALRAAPGEVRLAGPTPISSCFVAEQPTGALQTVGGAVIGAATELNRMVREGDGGATVELGYLVGAVQEGASGTAGVHQDLVLRLDSAARYPGPRGSRSALPSSAPSAAATPPARRPAERGRPAAASGSVPLAADDPAALAAAVGPPVADPALSLGAVRVHEQDHQGGVHVVPPNQCLQLASYSRK